MSIRDIEYNPAGLLRVRQLVDDQLAKAFEERGQSARDAIICEGTTEQLAQEALDKAAQCKDGSDTTSNELREIALWALVAAGVMEDESS